MSQASIYLRMRVNFCLFCVVQKLVLLFLILVSRCVARE